MRLDELYLTRQSCRSYDKDRQVNKEDLEKIIEAARLAPSARNAQPLFYTVVTNPSLLPTLRKACQSFGFNQFTDDVNAFIIIQENKDLANPTPRDFAQIDMGLATSQMILKATDLGLSTCILGGFDPLQVREACGIESEQPIRLVLTVGYAKADDPIRPKKRKDLDKIVKYL